MLRIIRSGFDGSGSLRIKQEIAALSREKKKSYLIVPEQQTVLAESEMSVILPSDAPLYFEATNFTRLANTVFRALGGICGEYCSSAKKALLMWRTLEELAPTLTVTSGGEISAGLVERMLSTVGELQSEGIDPVVLELAAKRAESLSDSRLHSKIEDLSRIYALYKSLLGERYSDTGDDAQMMVTRLAEKPEFFSDASVFIDGFTSFTAPQHKLLELLMQRTELTVYLCMPKHAESFFEYREVAETEKALTSSARRAGVEVKRIFESADASIGSRPLSDITTKLWRNFATFDNVSLQNPDELRILEARTPFEECEFIASDIKRRVMDGARFSDFAIIARSSDKYAGVLDSALTAAGIPIFTSYRRDAESFEAIKLIYSAYSAIRSGFAREDVITYAKCCGGISAAERDEFEMYVNRWQLTGRRFTDGIAWNMNPAGYETSRRESAGKALVRINATRDKLIEPLERFSAAVRRAKTVHEHATALVHFLTDTDTERTLARRAELLSTLGEREAAEENLALWDLICDALDELVEVNGECPADAESFLGQLKVLFASADMGRIPAACDEVTVGDADMLRLSGKKHIYLIGVNAGEFPAPPSDTSYITERDRLTLDSLGLPLKPESEVKNARELFYFTRAFSFAEETLTLLYSACDTRFKSIERAGVIDKLMSIVDGLTVVRISDLPTRELLWTPENALMRFGELADAEREALKSALIATGYEDTVRIAQGNIYNENLHLSEKKPYREGTPIALTQSRLDSFRACPLEHFCRYTVRLSEDEVAEFDASGIGTFIHAILENLFVRLRELGLDAGALTEQERRELTAYAAEKYVAELGEDTEKNSPRLRIKLDRLCRAAGPVVDGLCEEMTHSKFEPRFFELAISKDGVSGPKPVGIGDPERGEVFIYGIIDRVDTYRHGDDVYVRVIDYKTGKKDFSPDELAEGKNLQMLLYLRSLTESREFASELGATDGGKVIPAGVIYVKTNVGDTRVSIPDDAEALQAIRKTQGREGMVLDDEISLSAMDLRYTPLTEPGGSGMPRRNAEKYLYSAEGWQKLSRTVEDAVLRIADGIRSGDASAAPTADHGATKCEYCRFKPICRKPVIK